LARVYKPIRENIIVKVTQTEIKSAGGIIVASATARETMAREEGVVLSIGSRAFYDTHGISEELKEGDTVAFARYAGNQLEQHQDHEIRVLKDKDIICIIEEATEVSE
jgi:co-chaperonin GroES (HSP10)